MKKEIKICFPIYKLIYSLSFIFMLNLVRGVGSVDKIGGAIQAPIAILAIIFCADTYLTELQNHGAEVFHLYDTKHKSTVIIRRLMLQNIYLFGISLIGYGCFYLQKQMVLNGSSQAALVGTILFWSVVSMTICNLWRNIWVGIGSTLISWFLFNSQFGERIFRKWNVFSYTFRTIEQGSNRNWLYGEILSLGVALIMVILIPVILKKRG